MGASISHVQETVFANGSVKYHITVGAQDTGGGLAFQRPVLMAGAVYTPLEGRASPELRLTNDGVYYTGLWHRGGQGFDGQFGRLTATVKPRYTDGSVNVGYRACNNSFAAFFDDTTPQEAGCNLVRISRAEHEAYLAQGILREPWAWSVIGGTLTRTGEGIERFKALPSVALPGIAGAPSEIDSTSFSYAHGSRRLDCTGVVHATHVGRGSATCVPFPFPILSDGASLTRVVNHGDPQEKFVQGLINGQQCVVGASIRSGSGMDAALLKVAGGLLPANFQMLTLNAILLEAGMVDLACQCGVYARPEPGRYSCVYMYHGPYHGNQDFTIREFPLTIGIYWNGDRFGFKKSAGATISNVQFLHWGQGSWDHLQNITMACVVDNIQKWW